jgi:L-histidine N-alpha-methyltransferase
VSNHVKNLPVDFVHVGTTTDDFAADVRAGLTSTPKTLSPKYFYDRLGGVLFEAICELPEYYVTRAEDEILGARSGEILEAIGRHIRLIELGSGTARKTRHLIGAALSRQAALNYWATDIDATSLETTAGALAAEFDGLRVLGVAGTFESAITEVAARLPRDSADATLVLFLGSTIGNLEPDERGELLRSIRTSLRPGDAFLLGADSVKSQAILVPAYDDALGVTAAFNRNLLVRINRELGGTFDLATFRHDARYDAGLHRIEMHLVSVTAQLVRVPGAGIDIEFAEGESIHTESSYKFTTEMIESLARGTGFALEHVWTDARALFADYLLIAK